jgi:hypothetical protein
MNILITGDREWSTDRQLEQVLRVFSDLLIPVYGRFTVIHGDARGVDTMADIVGRGLNLTTIPCPAHWRHNEPKWVKAHGPCPDGCSELIGRPAGVLRNRYMLKTHTPGLVVAFHNNILNSRGTKDMVTIAKKAKIPVLVFAESSLLVPTDLTEPP